MKTLHLLRHAKSSWKDSTLKDFDRPLNKRGKLSANFIAKKLMAENFKPDLIYCSPAKRTKETYKYLNSTLNFKTSLDYKDEIYEAHYSTLLNLINNVDSKHNSVLLIGHNPGLSNLASELTNTNINLVTCNIISIEFEVENWDEVFNGCGEISRLDFPKKHDEFNKILWNWK